MWALATIAHPAATRELQDRVCTRFARLTHSSHRKQRANAQDVSNMGWSLAILNHTPQGGDLLDRLCLYSTTLFHSKDSGAHPSAQNVSNVAWSLAALKHTPPECVVSAWLQCLLAMCKGSGQPVASQNVSNLLLARAKLSLSISQDRVKDLVQHLLQMYVSKLDYQDCCNAAWSLAVMGHLDMTTFDSFLHQLTRKQSMVVATAVLISWKQKWLDSCTRLEHG